MNYNHSSISTCLQSYVSSEPRLGCSHVSVQHPTRERESLLLYFCVSKYIVEEFLIIYPRSQIACTLNIQCNYGYFSQFQVISKILTWLVMACVIPIQIYMSHFAYACKMRYPLNLVFENSEYLLFYSTFCIVILDYGLKLHKLSNHILGMLQKWLKIH